MSVKSREQFTLPVTGLPAPRPGARAGEGARGRAPGGPAQPGDMGPPSAGGALGVGCSLCWARCQDPGGPIPSYRDWDMERNLSGGEGA